jgi:hypothetical protein
MARTGYWLLLAVGVLMAANAIVSGSRAFDGGMRSVASLTAVGLVCMAVAAWHLRRWRA